MVLKEVFEYMKEKIKFESFDKDMPFFKDSMPKDYVPPETSKKKEVADKICKWLFSENDNEPVPKEALQFIEFMKVIHSVS